MSAAKAGADFVKIFPCAQMGGPSYLKILRVPFPQLRFIAAGGVNQLTAGDYIRAGAVAVGIGADLTHQDAIKRRDAGRIRERARARRRPYSPAYSAHGLWWHHHQAAVAWSIPNTPAALYGKVNRDRDRLARMTEIVLSSIYASVRRNCGLNERCGVAGLRRYSVQ